MNSPQTIPKDIQNRTRSLPGIESNTSDIEQQYNELDSLMIASLLNYERRPSNDSPTSPTTSDNSTLDDWADQKGADHQQSVLQYRRSSKKKSKQEWPCNVEGCSVILYSKSSRFRHQKLHENPENQYRCDKCDAKYLVKLDLVDHERRAHMSKDSYVVCDQCERTFSSMSNLNAHKEIHQRSATPKHVCTLCNVAYFHRSALHRHQRNDHGHASPSIEDFRNDHGHASPSIEASLPRSPYQTHARSPYQTHAQLEKLSHRPLHYTFPPMGQVPGKLILPPNFHHRQLPTNMQLVANIQPNFACTYCQVKCESLEELHNHLSAVHYLSSTHSCLINNCKHSVHSRSEYEEHIKLHPHAFAFNSSVLDK